MLKELPTLPVDGVLAELSAALEKHGSAVLVAEPGAGKTTRVPPGLLGSPWLGDKRIIMLEPRRIAARAAANHMAQLRSEKPGETVGYRIRFESRVSPQTKIEILTEGMLSRRLLSDTSLSDTGLVIFDEFHERTLEGDLGLALTLDVQAVLRPDLRILVMSATLEADSLSDLLGGAPIIRCVGRQFPVETRYTGRATRQSVAKDVADAVYSASRAHAGSILAFLPGEAEIRQAEQRLRERALGAGLSIHGLYGSLNTADQQRAIWPAEHGKRKVVLATNIAETSLTIEGVSIVIDGGYKRVPQFDPGSGMTRLETVRVSQASAEQRRGRAGRLLPGICYRLWPEDETRALLRFDIPEILQADQARFILDVAVWGETNLASVRLLDQPPAGAVSQARDLLRRLGAIDAQGMITAHGRAIAELPLHPRLAHMVIKAKERGEGSLAADIAALLQERDILQDRGDTNIASRLALLREDGRNSPPFTRQRIANVRLAAEQIRRLAGLKERSSDGDPGALVALAYDDRIAQARGRRGSFRMAGGGGAVIDAADPLAGEEYLAVATTDGSAGNARVFLAAPFKARLFEELFQDRIATGAFVRWDKRTEAVIAQAQRRFGELVLEDRRLDNADPEAVAGAMLEGLRSLGIDCLPFDAASRSLQRRVVLMRRIEPDEAWPNLDDKALMDTLESWLKPYLYGKTKRPQLSEISIKDALQALIARPLLRRLDELLPERVSLPSGSSIAIDYGEAEPLLRVKLQELFGSYRLPHIAQGKVRLKLELLSPAGRPLAVTQDLESFWANAYQQVRSEMRGRYPKHDWPENPQAAAPSRGVKRGATKKR